MSLKDVVNIGCSDVISATANYLQILNTFYSKENLRKNDLDISLDKQTLQLIKATSGQTDKLLEEIINNFDETKRQNIEIIKQNDELISLEKEILSYLKK